jgi:glycosyltransferase involved in cell wall biosynthesis
MKNTVSSIPLISICIPTFNRAEHLKRLLYSIRAQVSVLTYEVRVRDNASTDKTEDVFREIADNSDNWHYKKNTENLGGRKNIKLCTEDAEGEYVYIVGDDDYFVPNAFKTIESLLQLASINNVSSVFFNTNIPASKNNAIVKFEWLRFCSINVPAFITSVIWKGDIWRNYDYDNYALELSLPQLDCFIESCSNGKILLSNQAIFEVSHAESSSDINYWFMPRHALVDCFEYPLLYDKVLSCDEIDTLTRIVTHLRRLSLLREIYKKILVMYYCRDFYSEVLPLFEKVHKGSLYSFWILRIRDFVFKTATGNMLSAKYCSQKYGLQELAKKSFSGHIF